jgi:dUTP pyrophosphatase
MRISLVREGAKVPAYATEGSAGMDLCAAIVNPLTLQPGERAAIPTGVAIDLPDGYEAQIRPRSGLALKHGIGMVNGPGTGDSDYVGELHAILVNHGQEPYTFQPGERCAQMVIAPVTRVSLLVVDRSELKKTERGESGFGSSGKL